VTIGCWLLMLFLAKSLRSSQIPMSMKVLTLMRGSSLLSGIADGMDKLVDRAMDAAALMQLGGITNVHQSLSSCLIVYMENLKLFDVAFQIFFIIIPSLVVGFTVYMQLAFPNMPCWTISRPTFSQIIESATSTEHYRVAYAPSSCARCQLGLSSTYNEKTITEFACKQVFAFVASALGPEFLPVNCVWVFKQGKQAKSCESPLH
jgi:hypothetical protein